MLSECWVVVLCDPLLDFCGTVSCGECVWIQGFGGLDNGGLGDGSGMGAGGSACRGRLENGRRDCEGGVG